MERAPQPGDGGELDVTVGWLRFHRDALAAKCAGLTPEQLVERACLPSALSLLGWSATLREMERVYGAWMLGPKGPLEMVYGVYQDGGTEWDFAVDASMVDASVANWEAEMQATDASMGSHATPQDKGEAGGRSVRWALQKPVGEYARHNGHADLLRERLEGTTGE